MLGGIQKQGNDFQNQNYLYLYAPERCSSTTHNNNITSSNLITSLLYLSVRTSIPATWLNDRDQFTAPFFEEVEDEIDVSNADKTDDVNDNDKTNNVANNQIKFNQQVTVDKTKKVKHKHYLYEDDQDFINNCIVYALFTKNNTDWCLFDNDELGLEYSNRNLEVWNLIKQELSKKQLTNEAQDVYNIAKELYIYYHKNKCGKGSNVVVNNVTNNNSFDAVVYNLRSDIQHSNYLQIQNNSNTNNKTNFYNPLASWQDVLNAIKGVKVDKSGKASRCTKCEAYPEMRETIEQLSLKLKSLAKKIEEGVYKYGFLR